MLNESRETRADRIVIMHTNGIGVKWENPQFHSFEL
jgi:hypothetical protein